MQNTKSTQATRCNHHIKLEALAVVFGGARKAGIVLAIAFSVLNVSASEADAGTPIRFGWGSEIKTVASIDPDSEVGSEMGDTRVSVAMAWDWLWVVLPIWCSNREYVLHEDVKRLADDTLFWEMRDQTKTSVARITGVSENDLTFPFYAYIPPGWLALIALFVVGGLVSGPSPKKRFKKLTNDDDYVRSLDLMFQLSESSDAEESPDHDLAESETSWELRFDAAVSYLIAQGISKSNAQNNLLFLIDYLSNHPEATVRQPEPIDMMDHPVHERLH